MYEYCPPAPILRNTERLENGRLIGDVIVYHCKHGYQFERGGGTVRSIVCLPGRVWSAVIEDCQGWCVWSPL